MLNALEIVTLTWFSFGIRPDSVTGLPIVNDPEGIFVKVCADEKSGMAQKMNGVIR
jgi:hypothetical protein